MSQSQAPERWTFLAALFYTGFASAGLLVAKPLIVGALIDQYGFSPRQAGFVAGIEMIGIGAAAFMVGVLGSLWGRRSMVLTGATLGIVGSLVPFVAGAFPAVLGLRLVAGLGCGLVAGVVLGTLGSTRNPDRTFGLYFTSSYLGGALLFFVSSYVIGTMGADGAYYLLAAILFIVFATGRAFPATPLAPRAQSDVAGEKFPLGIALLSLAVSLVFWISSGAFWAFAERIARNQGIDPAQIGAVLSLSQIAAIAGAVTVSLLGMRIGRAVPTFAAMLLTILGLTLVGRAHTSTAFAAGIFSICFGWPVFLAYLNGTMSAIDRTGRVVALSVTSQTVGMAIGPAVAGQLVTNYGYGSVLMLGYAASCVAIALLVPLVIATRSVASIQRDALRVAK